MPVYLQVAVTHGNARTTIFNDTCAFYYVDFAKLLPFLDECDVYLAQDL